MPRPVAFSGALKRKQLRERRARHNEREEELQQRDRAPVDETSNPNIPTDSAYAGKLVKNYSKEFVPETSRGSSSRAGAAASGVVSNHPVQEKLRSVFSARTQGDIKQSKLASMKPLELLPDTGLEVSFEEMFPSVIGFPKRPQWDYKMSRERLENNEQQMFHTWLQSVYDRYPAEELSYFEQNLEVWRQLWRVLEISDIIMIIVDIRHPVIHFPPSLYRYVVEEMNRKLVVVFNKVDLVAPHTLFSWQHYFKEKFPELHLASFSCYPRDPLLINDSSTAALQRVVKRQRRRFYNAVGVRDVLAACKDVKLEKKGQQVDWDSLIAMHKGKNAAPEQDESDDIQGSGRRTKGNGNKSNHKNKSDDDDDDQEPSDELADAVKSMSIVADDQRTPHGDYVTIGLVGHPNVGKSSLINSIMGKTVVSTSRTPGHTKHFQTIHLTENVRLCDSPGLVFPSLLPKPLQILSGMYPVAQVREPYSVVAYLAERINLPRLLKLEPPENYERGPFRWSAYAICESFGYQRGFLTAKSGYPDVYRAANTILRLANDGRILLSFKPPGYFSSTKYEVLRVEEADRAEEEEGDVGEYGHENDSEEEEEEDDDQQDTDSDEEAQESQASLSQDILSSRSSHKSPAVKARVGGFFGLLQDDDGESTDDNDDEEDDEDEEEKV